MKYEIEIPDGQFCDGCIMLEEDYFAGLRFCKLLPEDSSFIDYTTKEENIVKHKDCPSLKK